MIRKLSLVSLLTLSLTCFGQVISNGGYAANVAPSAAMAPITSTPDVALPGSGPAVGAPLGNTNTNDSRFATGPSFVSRNALPNEVVDSNYVPATDETATNGAAISNDQTLQMNNAATAAATEPFNIGIQHFVSGAPGAATNSASLAEIAKQVRGESHPAARVFNNDTIQQLNARGVRTGNIVPGNTNVDASNAAAPTANSANNATAANSEPRGTLLAQNEAGPMPQSDQVAPPSRTADQRRQTPSAQTPSNSAPAANDSANQNASAAQPSNNADALPQTGSSLPLLLIIGFVGLAAGTIYLLRR
jgi:LPXTG-motif cell wall-anchored protein